MSPDSISFRSALGCFPTGVTVVTSRTAAGEPVGVTIGSFTSLSLTPPLVLFCLDRANTEMMASVEKNGFVVNVLEASQKDLSARFGSRNGKKWDGLTFDRGENDLPVLKGCLATLECRTVDAFEGGDHKIFVGQVDHLARCGEGAPLLHFRGTYHTIPEALV